MNHVWAIKEAVESAQQKGSLDKALAVEAFGAHYLTDAFSAGHVRTPRLEAKVYWDGKVPMFVYNLTGYIAEAVAKNLGTWQKRVIPTDVTLRHDFPFGLGAYAQVQELLKTKRFTFGDVVGLALHDWDNAKGLKATSHGHDVQLLGDDRLVAVGNDAMPHAIKAVREGVAEIDQAFALGHKGQDLDTVLDSLLDKDLFAAEKWLPNPKSDAEQTADSKSIKWKSPDVFSPLADDRFREAVKLFLKEKAGVLKEVAAGLEPDPRSAFQKGVLNKLESDPIGTLTAVVQWVPSQTKSKPWEAENAATYYHEAEKISAVVRRAAGHQPNRGDQRVSAIRAPRPPRSGRSRLWGGSIPGPALPFPAEIPLTGWLAALYPGGRDSRGSRRWTRSERAAGASEKTLYVVYDPDRSL